MKTESGFYFGNVPTELGEVLSRYFQQLPAFRSALVLSIDSTSTPCNILSIMVRFGVQARLEGTAVLVLPEQLYRAARVPVFTGFDEVRLFEHERPEKEVPSRLVLTSDAVDFNERLPDALEAYMRETRCVLALGDGCGLNYATWDSAFAAFIEAKFQASMGDGEK